MLGSESAKQFFYLWGELACGDGFLSSIVAGYAGLGVEDDVEKEGCTLWIAGMWELVRVDFDFV